MISIIRKIFIPRSVSAGGQKNRRIFLAIIFIVIIVMFLFNNKYVMASDTNPLSTVGNWGAGTIGWAVSAVLSVIAYVLTAVIGLLITLVVALLIQVAQFSNIINVPTVIEGWVIVRDLCNMLFILILLVIAFATILRIESYNYKKILPKLLIMAVLINFSRTIFGLFIDFSQVIMLTFVNAFSAGGGHFISIFQTNMLLSIQTTTASDFNVSAWATSMSIIAGVIAAIITLIVVSVMLAILVMRIIMLWIYTIFSPLVFMGFAVPAIQKYTGKIWEDFVKQLVVGPVLAFFIWLALTTASSSSGLMSQNIISGSTAEVCVGAGKFFCQGSFQQFLIVIGLLMGGLMVAQQMGGAAGSLAGGALGKIKSAGAFVGGAPMALGKFGLFKAGRMADTLQIKGQGAIAKFISKKTDGVFGEKYQAKSLNYRMIKGGWDRGQAVKMRDYEGTKAGAWQDQFNRTTSASIGIPIVSQIMRKKAEKQARVHEDNIKKEQKGNEDDEVLLAKEKDPQEQEKIKNRIKGREEKINEHKKNMREEIKKSQESWILGKLPPQRHARLQEQERANEAHARIKKEEDPSEKNLVHNFQVADEAGNESDKRGYINHLADTNGINSLFDAEGIEMTAENISKFFKEKFGEAAGDVAAEVSRRAEAVGNYKLMGFHKFDVAQGKNRLVDNIDDQKGFAMIKDDQRYAQNHARTTHVDSLIDRTKDGPKLSELGVEQLLHIASSAGRMSEIGKGNYQSRYGQMVIKLEKNIKVKADEFRDQNKGEEADGLLRVLAKFKENYSLSGKIERPKNTKNNQTQEEKTSDDD